MVKHGWILLPMVVIAWSLNVRAGQAQEEKPYARGSTSWQKIEGPFYSNCSKCHQRLGKRLSEEVGQWRNSVHYRNGVFCDSCHGGDPSSTVLPVAMGEQNGFLSAPDAKETPDFCGPRCHQEEFAINEANVHTDEFEDNDWEPNCVTCHGSHEVQEVSTDLISLQERSCGPCHKRSFYLRQTEKSALEAANSRVNELYAELDALPDTMPTKSITRLRLDAAGKKLRQLAHYFNRKQIRKAKAPIDAELKSIQAVIEFNGSATR